MHQDSTVKPIIVDITKTSNTVENISTPAKSDLLQTNTDVAQVLHTSDADSDNEDYGKNYHNYSALEGENSFSTSLKTSLEIDDFAQFCRDYPEAYATEAHWRELHIGSGIANDIIALNLKSVGGHLASELILGNIEVTRTNSGVANQSTLRSYGHILEGGWWCNGVDVLGRSDQSNWGQLKPDKPGFDPVRQREIKYQSPTGIPSGIYALRLPRRIKELHCQDEAILNGADWEFWHYVREMGLPLILCEGAKKTAALLSQGYLAIGLAGVWNWGKKGEDLDARGKKILEFIPEVKFFAEVPRDFTICFDQDTKHQAKVGVNQAITKLSWKLKELDNEIKILSWLPKLGKGIDDVIARADGKERLDLIIENALPFIEWSALQLNQLNTSADLVLNQPRLGDIKIPVDANDIKIRSPKKTGKTHTIASILNALPEGTLKLVISHRIQLGKALCTRFNLPYVDESGEAAQAQKYLDGYALCIHSLHEYSKANFHYEQWKGAVIVLDEVVQMVWSLLTDPNMKNNRVRIINNLKKLINFALSTGGKLIYADADLNDPTVQFIRGLIEVPTKSFTVVNDYVFSDDAWRVCNFTQSTPNALIKTAFDKLKEGKKIFFCLSSQKVKGKYSTQYLGIAIKKRFPDLKVLIVDSQSVNDPQHEAFGCTQSSKVDGKDVMILDQICVNYDVVLTSPVIETGVSVENPHFDFVFGVFGGVQPEANARQHLSRYRPAVPRFVWFRATSSNQIGNGAIYPGGILKDERQRQSRIVKDLKEAGLSFDIESGQVNTPCMNLYVRLGAYINYTAKNYRQSAINNLELEGHIIGHDFLPGDDNLVMPSEGEQSQIKTELKEGCDIAYDDDCTATSNAVEIDPVQLETLSKKAEKTKAEIRSLRKAYLKKSYGAEEVTPELIKADDKKLYGKLNLLFYWSSQGRDLLSKIDILKAEKAHKYSDGEIFMLDFKSVSRKVAFLDLIGLNDLMKLDDYNPKDCREVQKACDVILENFYRFKTEFFPQTSLSVLRKDIEATPIKVVQKILGWVGLKAVRGIKKGVDGHREQFWRLAVPAFDNVPEYKTIFDYWRTRDLERLEKHEASKQAELEQLASDEECRKAFEAAAIAAPAPMPEMTEEESIPPCFSPLDVTLGHVAALGKMLTNKAHELKGEIVAEARELLAHLVSEFAPGGWWREEIKSRFGESCKWLNNWIDAIGDIEAEKLALSGL
ncbi:plasmid replication protein, CyRepA1 family [Nodularia chucula]|uniref:plasmid replication protein, CyRepA1 family n=1 Tax=Nodularia chucula TaxID=3093667 RepID=UPI0039C6500B